jgi:hypothetical protein
MALLCAKTSSQPDESPNAPGHRQGTQHSGKQPNGKLRGDQRPSRPSWYDKAPNNLNQTHQYDNRVWHWCPKCGASGKWVCTHSAGTHKDNFVKKRRGDQTHGERRPSPSPPPTAQAAATVDHVEIARLVAAQLANQFQANVAAPVVPAPSPPAPHVASSIRFIPHLE